jgi:hypothetical protein
MDATCTHLDAVDPTAVPSALGCEECLNLGTPWVHLRMCRTCGHIGCCDASPGRHARAHAAQEGHPVISSFEPGETWWWCFVDDVAFEVPSLPLFEHA